MNKLSALAALVALASFNLVACAEPEEGDATGESAITNADDRETFQQTFAATDDDALATPDFTAAAVADPGTSPFAGISPEQKAGILTAPVPSAADGKSDWKSSVLGSCKATYLCERSVIDQPGQPPFRLTLRHEGGACVLGDIVLSDDASAKYTGELTASGTWLADAGRIDVTFTKTAVSTRCELAD
ncbi:MAG: hypothetical protein KF894_03440 [Labilithrix sp.]|nr:hypothetical protein [Labilithrix sp.]